MRRLFEAIHTFVKSGYFYPLVWLACAVPFVVFLKNALPVVIPAYFPDTTFQFPWDTPWDINPTKDMLHATGRDALACLLIALTITPLRRLTGWNRVQIVRRTIGVWSFAYAFCHLMVYLAFDRLFDFSGIVEDVFKRKFIFVGMFTFTILLALAITSTNGMIRRLKRRWQTLHRLAYVAAVCGVIHFAWGQKADIHEPLQWGAYLAVMLGLRVWFTVQKRLSPRAVPLTR